MAKKDIPAYIQAANQALNDLKNHDEYAELKRQLPSLAANLHRAGETVTVDVLAAEALKGAAEIKKMNIMFRKNVVGKALTYDAVLKELNDGKLPDQWSARNAHQNRSMFHSHLENFKNLGWGSKAKYFDDANQSADDIIDNVFKDWVQNNGLDRRRGDLSFIFEYIDQIKKDLKHKDYDALKNLFDRLARERFMHHERYDRHQRLLDRNRRDVEFYGLRQERDGWDPGGAYLDNAGYGYGYDQRDHIYRDHHRMDMMHTMYNVKILRAQMMETVFIYALKTDDQKMFALGLENIDNHGGLAKSILPLSLCIDAQNVKMLDRILSHPDTKEKRSHSTFQYNLDEIKKGYGDGDNLYIQALRSGNIKIIKTLVKHGFKVSWKEAFFSKREGNDKALTELLYKEHLKNCNSYSAQQMINELLVTKVSGAEIRSTIKDLEKAVGKKFDDIVNLESGSLEQRVIENGTIETFEAIYDAIHDPQEKADYCEEMFEHSFKRLRYDLMRHIYENYGDKFTITSDDIVKNIVEASKSYTGKTDTIAQMTDYFYERNILKNADMHRMLLSSDNYSIVAISVEGLQRHLQKDEFNRLIHVSIGRAIGTKRYDNVGLMLSYMEQTEAKDMIKMLNIFNNEPNGYAESNRSMINSFGHIKSWRETKGANPPLEFVGLNPNFYESELTETLIEIMNEREGYPRSHTAKIAYAVAAIFKSEENVMRYLKKWGTSGNKPLHDTMQNLVMPEKMSTDINMDAWQGAIIAHGPKMARLFKFADKLPSPIKAKDGINWSYHETLNEVAKYAYKNGTQNPELAGLFMRYTMSEKQFNTAIEWIKKYNNAFAKNGGKKPENLPQIKLDGKDFGLDGAKFYKLNDGDYRGIILGELTDCCQSVGNVGRACAEHGFLNENGGFYVVEDRKGEIIGQAWAWQKDNAIVFDSLEYLRDKQLGPRVNSDQWQALCQKFAEALQKDKKFTHIESFRVGSGGKTPRMDFNKASSYKGDRGMHNYARETGRPTKPQNVEVIKPPTAYADSSIGQYIVWKK